MSASPAGHPSTTPNGGVPPIHMRRKPKANPLVTGSSRRPPPKKQTGRPSHLPPPRANASAPAPTNGSTPAPARPTQPYLTPNILPDEKYTEHPVFTTKRALLEGLRHHVLRLQTQEQISLLDDSFFRRPLHLYRRDPRHNPRNHNGDAMDIDSKEDLEEIQAREKAEAARDERRKQREENLALIAPSSQKPKQNQFQRRTENLYRPADTPEAQRRQQLRYEEALPWHLEDMPQTLEKKEGDEIRTVEDQNVWIGSYEAALSECHVILYKVPLANGQVAYRLVPLEKWYKFTAKPKHRIFSAEEADKVMSKKFKEPKWIMEQLRNQEREKNIEHDRQRNRGLFVRSAGRGDEDKKGVVKADDDGLEAAFAAGMDEANEIDFEHDELFADDEGEGIIEGEDMDVKAAETRIKREQLGANFFDYNDEKQVDEAEELQKKLEKLKKDKEKNLKKALVKREKRFDEYASDSESFNSNSDDDSSDSDKSDTNKDEADKEKNKDKGKDALAKKDATGGTSSIGANTPSGRTKTIDALKKPGASANLKRPGSPNLSDASGNESSRKKQKKGSVTALSSTLPSRPMSPDGVRKHRTGAGSGSDTDGERKPRPSHLSKNGTPRGSPGGSRAGSPAPMRAPPSTDEIRAQIPATGISTTKLLDTFGGKLAVSRWTNFVALLKSVSTYDKESKLLFPKNTPTGTPGAR